ncbi:hypothetical protein [Streptomyces sp. NPDC001774]
MLGIALPLTTATAVGIACPTSSAAEVSRVAVVEQRAEVTTTYYVSAGMTTSPQDLWCPVSNPYLINEKLAPGRAVPFGVRVTDRIEFGNWPSSWVSTIALSQERETGGVRYAAGVKGLVMTNWNLFVSFGLDITLVCTNKTDEAARI